MRLFRLPALITLLCSAYSPLASAAAEPDCAPKWALASSPGAVITSLFGFAKAVAGEVSAAPCASKGAFVKEALGASAPLRGLTEKILAGNPKLVVLGESHHERGRGTVYPWLFDELKAKMPAPFCLLLEFEQVADPGGTRHTGDFSEIRGFVRDYQQGKLPSVPDDVVGSWYTRLLPAKPSERHADRLLIHAEKSGAPVFLVDQPSRLWKHDSEKQHAAWMNDRDTYMAAQVKELFRSGKCKSALQVNGKAHITAEEPGRVTMKDHLSKSGIPASYVNIVDPLVTGQNPDRSWLWKSPSGAKLCDGDANNLPKSNIFFSIPKEMKQKYKDLPLGNDDGFGQLRLTARWSDFDHAAILACPDAGSVHCGQ